MPTWWVIPVAGAFFLSVALTDIVRGLAIRFNILDRPTKKRKQHCGAVPALGGVAIFFAFMIPTLLVLAYSDFLTVGYVNIGHFFGFFAGGAVLLLGGVLDDKFDLAPKYAILFPIIAALTAATVGIGPSKITNPFGGVFEIAETVAFLFTFFWLIGMTYTTKLLDGIDGLATGVTAIGVFMMVLLALSKVYYQPDFALLGLIAFAALMGFLFWNWSPAHIFLGEGGSTFIGYMLGVLAILSGSKVATALLVVGIPIFDIIFVLTQRHIRGKSLFTGDRLHLHHKLFDLGFSSRQVVMFYFCIATIFGLTTLIFESWQKLIALCILFLVMLFLSIAIARKKQFL